MSGAQPCSEVEIIVADISAGLYALVLVHPLPPKEGVPDGNWIVYPCEDTCLSLATSNRTTVVPILAKS
jgi:hypothetical protein